MHRILVICSQYPDDTDYSKGSFFHVRNMYYFEKGNKVEVLSFETEHDYELNGIKVYSLKTINSICESLKYDLVVCHAPKIQQHFKFINEHKEFRKIVFIFHGNEVLDTYRIAPYRYPYLPSAKIFNKLKRKTKDKLKLILLKYQLRRNMYRSFFVFVSNWMKENMEENIGISDKEISDKCVVINNSVGKPFEQNDYIYDTEKEYDFITIRAQLDGAKYAIDIVRELAIRNNQYSFLIIGRGDYFKHYNKPDNITLIETTLEHEEIIEYLNKARCSLLPTRWDSQGLMTCETATFGIPTITSDIPICHEMLDGFENVAFIDNDSISSLDLEAVLSKLLHRSSGMKNERFFAKNTMQQEIDLFSRLLKKYETEK